MSLQYLNEAVASNDAEKLIRYVRLHLGDGNKAAGRKEIDKAWVESLKLLLDVPANKPRIHCQNSTATRRGHTGALVLPSALLFRPTFRRMDS